MLWLCDHLSSWLVCETGKRHGRAIWLWAEKMQEGESVSYREMKTHNFPVGTNPGATHHVVESRPLLTWFIIDYVYDADETTKKVFSTVNNIIVCNELVAITCYILVLVVSWGKLHTTKTASLCFRSQWKKVKVHTHTHRCSHVYR